MPPKKIFHGSVVIWAARIGHGRMKVVFFAQVEVCVASVLRPLVTGEGESISDLFCDQGISDRQCNQRCRHDVSNAVSQYHSPVEIDNYTHVQQALKCRNISDICYSEPVGLALLKGTLQHVSLRLGIRRIHWLIHGIHVAFAIVRCFSSYFFKLTRFSRFQFDMFN